LSRDFLLEVGTEEMPAKVLAEAGQELVRAVETLLAEQRLSHGEVIGYAAPRRLAVLVKQVAERQEDLVQEVRGPSAQAAFDAAGRPTKAAQGFARAHGVKVEELAVRGGYVYAVKRQAGRPAPAVLAEELPRVLAGLRFPKSMRWGRGSLRFLRPVRWLVALYGSEVVEFSLAGVPSGPLSRGHRFLHPGPVEIPEAGEYRAALARAGVVVDREERRRRVAALVRQAAAEVGGEPMFVPGLLEEVADLVEHPTAVRGSFAPQHLSLPPEVLTMVMAGHQRFFPVTDRAGRLLPYFVGVRDGGEKGLAGVRAGYERVLEARLVDAQFFFREDQKEALATRVERLKDVIFQEHLGSMYDKALRLRYLAGRLSDELGLSSPEREAAERAAWLAKADLVSNMVYEFPELAGIMGGYYARQQGESEAVALAIREHYLPRYSGDALPATPAGTVVSLADKLDTLVGYWSVGVTPSGSEDPYGLRRLAYGLCELLVDKDFRLSWRELLLEAYGQYEAAGRARLSFAEVEEGLKAFVGQRLANMLEERGIRYDVVNAALGAGWDRMAQAARRAQALQDLVGRPELEALVTLYTRARNLARSGSPGSPVNPDRLREPAEAALYRALASVRHEAARCLAKEDYRGALLALAGLERPLAEFFDRVLVMAEDPELRANRLALLSLIVRAVEEIADLSQIRTG
jgi:glycyl-tRNA synthetase beta chain